MKSVVVYKTKTGFTKKYAEWIAEELACKAVAVKDFTKEELNSYDTIIYGGGITAGMIGGLKKFKSWMLDTSNKKFIVFATGGVPYEVYEKEDQVRNANFTELEKQHIPYYYFQGGINYENMKLGSRLMMRMFASILRKKKNKTPEEQASADMMAKSYDHSDRKFIQPLIQCVRESL